MPYPPTISSETVMEEWVERLLSSRGQGGLEPVSFGCDRTTAYMSSTQLVLPAWDQVMVERGGWWC